MGASPGRFALAEAVRHVGVRESPPGSNSTSFGRWFGVDGVPWCAIYVSYCFNVGARVVLCRGWHGAGVGPKGVAYVPTLEAWLRATRRWVDDEPQPGDLVIFDWDGGISDHVGIVVRPLDGDSFATVEGDVGDDPDADGTEVMRCERQFAQAAGFGRISF